MAAVYQDYQATDTKLNRQVALKILPEAFVFLESTGGETADSQRWSFLLVQNWLQGVQ